MGASRGIFDLGLWLPGLTAPLNRGRLDGFRKANPTSAYAMVATIPQNPPSPGQALAVWTSFWHCARV